MRKPLKKVVASRTAYLTVLLLGFIIFGVFLIANQSSSGYKPNSETVSYSTGDPSEVKPNPARYKWQGADDEPKYIDLPTIASGGFIQKVGVDQNKQVAVPDNIHIAGWFVDMVKPGQNGLSIIDGHVDGRGRAGIFNNLINLKQNDKFTVELGNGSKLTYKVMDVKSVKTAEAANLLFSQNPKVKKQLNLITCGGNFDTQSRQYQERVIISAEQLT